MNDVCLFLEHMHIVFHPLAAWSQWRLQPITVRPYIYIHQPNSWIWQQVGVFQLIENLFFCCFLTMMDQFNHGRVSYRWQSMYKFFRAIATCEVRLQRTYDPWIGSEVLRPKFFKMSWAVYQFIFNKYLSVMCANPTFWYILVIGGVSKSVGWTDAQPFRTKECWTWAAYLWAWPSKCIWLPASAWFPSQLPSPVVFEVDMDLWDLRCSYYSLFIFILPRVGWLSRCH